MKLNRTNIYSLLTGVVAGTLAAINLDSHVLYPLAVTEVSVMGALAVQFGVPAIQRAIIHRKLVKENELRVAVRLAELSVEQMIDEAIEADVVAYIARRNYLIGRAKDLFNGVPADYMVEIRSTVGQEILAELRTYAYCDLYIRANNYTGELIIDGCNDDVYKSARWVVGQAYRARLVKHLGDAEEECGGTFVSMGEEIELELSHLARAFAEVEGDAYMDSLTYCEKAAEVEVDDILRAVARQAEQAELQKVGN